MTVDIELMKIELVRLVYADWLETKLAIFTEQLLQHGVMQAEASDEVDIVKIWQVKS